MTDNMDLIRDMFDCAQRGINDELNKQLDAESYEAIKNMYSLRDLTYTIGSKYKDIIAYICDNVFKKKYKVDNVSIFYCSSSDREVFPGFIRSEELSPKSRWRDTMFISTDPIFCKLRIGDTSILIETDGMFEKCRKCTSTKLIKYIIDRTSDNIKTQANSFISNHLIKYIDPIINNIADELCHVCSNIQRLDIHKDIMADINNIENPVIRSYIKINIFDNDGDNISGLLIISPFLHDFTIMEMLFRQTTDLDNIKKNLINSMLSEINLSIYPHVVKGYNLGKLPDWDKALVINTMQMILFHLFIDNKNNLFDACTYMLDDIIEYYYSSICGVMAQRYIDLETDINYLFSNMITQIRYYYNDIQQLNVLYEY